MLEVLNGVAPATRVAHPYFNESSCAVCPKTAKVLNHALIVAESQESISLLSVNRKSSRSNCIWYTMFLFPGSIAPTSIDDVSCDDLKETRVIQKLKNSVSEVTPAIKHVHSALDKRFPLNSQTKQPLLKGCNALTPRSPSFLMKTSSFSVGYNNFKVIEKTKLPEFIYSVTVTV